MGKKNDKKSDFELKTPKGTRDWIGNDMVLRERIFNAITTVFKRHGAVALDTPVFELKEILAGKYGEDSKLIYDIQDQGGELCSLRYDLTVPLARYLAMNKDIQNLKRYHIAKVYRRDQPAIKKGRLREFFQCDIDIAGVYDPMIPDAEILSIIVEVFVALEWDAITIKLNHRKILDGLFAVTGVPADKIRAISSAIDKLDKLPWKDVRKEMTDGKGLEGAVADKIGEYVKYKGGRDIVDMLKADPALATSEDAQQGLSEMELLFTYMDLLGVTDKVSFDLSLARGLDYYTGVIFEVVTEGSAPANMVTEGSAPVTTPVVSPTSPSPVNIVTEGSTPADIVAEDSTPANIVTEDSTPADIITVGSTPAGIAVGAKILSHAKKSASPAAADDVEDRSNDPSVGVGSVAAGGRYDNLVGMFGGKRQIPCVGISFGVDRIFSVMKARIEREAKGSKGEGRDVRSLVPLRASEIEVYVMAVGKTKGNSFTGLLPERMAMARELWAAGVKAEFSAKVKPRLQQQFKAAEAGGVPLAVVLGEDELAQAKVRLKVLGLNLPDDHPDQKGRLVGREELVGEIRKELERLKL